MNGQVSRKSRLTAYSALAGAAIPAAAASAGFVGESNLDINVDEFNSPVAVDFGPGFGELFLFSAYFSSSSTNFYGGGPERGIGGTGFLFTSFSSMNVQFNPANAGGWTAASIIAYNNSFRTQGWPDRLSTGDLINAAANWVPMNQNSAYEHLLAGRSFTSSSFSTVPSRAVGSIYTDSTTFGAFANDPGFLGVRLFASDGETNLFAWIDVDATLGGGPARFNPSLTIDAWGIEIDGNPIRAGLPTPGAGALALLALGAAGIRRSRRHSDN